MKQYKWVKHDIAEIKELGHTKKRTAKLLKQYAKRGWTDIDTWSLDASLARLILPRLKRFRKITKSTPQGGEDKWDAILGQIVEAFEFAVSPEYYAASAEKVKKFKEAMLLFAKVYRDLWS